MELYLDQPVAFEKIATEVDLPEDALQWPQEVMQELYKQVPYVADFYPDVNMETVNAEQGYGFGHFEVQNKSEVPAGATPEQEAQIGVQHVRIPIIIKDFKLQPFDFLITADSKMLPLTEARLRQALFRPQTFDVTSRTPGDQSMVGQLYPPYRQNYGFGGGGGMASSVDMGKTGSALEGYLSKEAFEADKKDVVKRIADALGLDPKSVEHLAKEQPVQTLGVEKKSAVSVPEQDPKFNQHRMGGAVGGIGAGAGLFEGFQHSRGMSPLARAGMMAGGALLGGGMGYGVGSVAGHAVDKVHQKQLGKAAAASYPVSDAALKIKVKDVVPKVKVSMLEAIADTVYETDYERVAEALGKHAASYLANKAYTRDALQKVAGLRPISLTKRACAYAPAMRPDVVQLVRGQDGYVVKSACSHAWQPSAQEVDRGQAVRMFGEKVVLAADATGAVTMEEGPSVVAGDEPTEKPEVVSTFGLYKVRAADGRELVGFVLPNLIDADGSIVPISLFTNGSEASLQPEIVGLPAGAGHNLPVGVPQGEGTFFRIRNGALEATVPMSIKGGLGEGTFAAETFDGKQLSVALQPNVKRAVGIDGTLVLPQDFQWCPMGEAKEVELVGDPLQFNKQAEAVRDFASVLVRAGDENSFSFDGIPVTKLAAEQRSFLTYDDAMFLLAGLGTDARYGATKLAESLAFGQPVEVRVGRHLTPATEAWEQSRKTASVLLAHIPTLKADLVKEAAFIPDPTAVDTVLSLGFINPENIRVFVGYLPKLEDTQSKLCELLLAARLGVRDIPVGALEKTVKTLESVIEGLKTLAFVDKQE